MPERSLADSAMRKVQAAHDRLAALAPQLDWAPNIWMGVTIENRRFVQRADVMREVPSAVRFISAEPLPARWKVSRSRALIGSSPAVSRVQGTVASTRAGSATFVTGAWKTTCRSSSSNGAGTDRSRGVASWMAASGTSSQGQKRPRLRLCALPELFAAQLQSGLRLPSGASRLRGVLTAAA